MVYLHIGWNTVIQAEGIIAILDYDAWQSAPEFPEMMSGAQMESRVHKIHTSHQQGRPIRSVIFYGDALYLSPITPETLQERLRHTQGLPHRSK